jgi:hypothetical protein
LILKDDEALHVEKAKIDYLQFQPHEPDIGESEAHILEVYDFAADFKTQDLITSLSMSSKDFDIKWVDDTHALVVFSSQLSATEALKNPYHNMKLRRLEQGTRESKIKAKRCAEYVMPYKERPKTSAALARRLVTGALGLKVNISPEQRAEERKRLQEAKERRKMNHKQTSDVWEGKVS